MTTNHRHRHVGAKRAIRRALAYLRWICRTPEPNGRSTSRHVESVDRAFPACYHVE